MTNNKHISVFLKKSIDFLVSNKNGIYVDCTLGRGGHSKLILDELKDGKLFSLDQDIEAIDYCSEYLKDYKNLKLIKSNFSNLKTVLSFEDVFSVDGILFDLGVSSPQLDNPERGFSYNYDSKLDMRMDKENPLSAFDVVNTFSKEEIAKILWEYGDEKFSRSIANNIISSRKEKQIQTTFELNEIIKKSLPEKVKKLKKHPAKKTFQALRIFVNDEISVLRKTLREALNLLNINGRVVVITFHSLEEKVVNEIFKEYTYDESYEINKKLPIALESKSNYKLLTKRPIKPDTDEINNNNRSHSAKLWAIERIRG